MSSITGSSSYSASASKGFSGLVSGLDTEDMVTKLLTGTQAKIDKQNANKQVLAWKQSMYRDVVTSMNNFKLNFFSFTSQNNLLSESFFNSMSAVSSSTAVKVSAGQNAQAGPMTIENIKLATNHSEKSGSTVTADVSGELDIGKLALLENGSTLDLTLDGVRKTLILNTGASNATDFSVDLQAKINNAFGNGVTVTNDVNTLTFTTSDSRQITLSGEDQVMTALGIKSGASNKINLNMSLKDINFNHQLVGSEFNFTINSVAIEATEEDTLGTLLNKINSSAAGVKVSYSSLEDKFIMTSTNSGEMGSIENPYLIQLENQNGNVLTALFGDTTVVTEAGKNALLTVNGIEVERNNNDFTIDGVQIELLKETVGLEKIEITISRNTEKVYQGIKKFVEEYNALLDKLNGLIGAEPNYKKHAPLTAEQKKEMSEREIELWETKAQEGLLRQDDNIRQSLSDMRLALYKKPEGAKYAIYDLGIETGSWSEKGKLVIPDPPTKLMAALANDPQEIEKLFSDSEKGIATQINKIIDASAKVSSGSPGILVRLSGAASLVDGNSTLGKQIIDIEEVLKRLANTYETEKTRYWKQFNSMEQMISQLNQQSSWLSSQFSQ